MTEAAAIRSTAAPAPVESLTADFAALGWVCGGAQAVILALQAALGPDGTLVTPTHSAGLTDPAGWRRPPMPPEWWPTIRATMPAYDPDLTPTRGMGTIPETFRKARGAIRSPHPHSSFAARGPHAASICGDHPPPFSMGDDSPLAKIYGLAGAVLLLDVGHANNTPLHLAEYRARAPAGSPPPSPSCCRSVP